MSQKANSVTIDIDYLTGHHHKYTGLSEIDQRRYCSLWAMAAKLGRELLPEAFNGDDLTALKQLLCWNSRGTVAARSLQVLAQKRLIVLPTINDRRRIAVVGLKDRYPTRPIDVFESAPWFGLGWIGSKELKNIPAAPVVDNSKPEVVKATDRKSPSLAMQANQEDVGDVLAHWSRRFPGVEIPESLAQKILVVCQDRENWRDPRWLVDQVNLKADDPVAYLATLLRKKPLPQPADGERAYWSWDRWVKRARDVSVGNSVGSVLKSMAESS